jgi:Mg2+/Co2+ transporter CorB
MARNISNTMSIAANDLVIPLRHSKLGLISLGLAIITGLVTFLLFIYTYIPEKGTFAQLRVSQILFIFSMIIAPILHLIGLILGIAGVFKKDYKAVLSVVGLGVNAVGLILIVGYWLLIVLLLAALNSLGGWR